MSDQLNLNFYLLTQVREIDYSTRDSNNRLKVALSNFDVSWTVY